MKIVTIGCIILLVFITGCVEYQTNYYNYTNVTTVEEQDHYIQPTPTPAFVYAHDHGSYYTYPTPRPVVTYDSYNDYYRWYYDKTYSSPNCDVKCDAYVNDDYTRCMNKCKEDWKKHQEVNRDLPARYV
jgi:hypothetical protein